MKSEITIIVVLVLISGCLSGASVTKTPVQPTGTEESREETAVDAPELSSGSTITSINEQKVGNTPKLPYRRIELYSNISELNVTEVEKGVRKRIQLLREEHGEKSLALDTRLDKISRRHSYSMVTKDFYSHVDPHFGGPSQRMNAYGYDCPEMLGETIHAVPYDVTLEKWNTTYNLSEESQIARFIVDSWMHSPEHRHELLDEEYDVVGVGIFVSKDGRILVTAEFCG